MKINPAIVIGAGGHSRTVISTLQSIQHPIKGILDKSIIENESILNVPIIGSIFTWPEYLQSHNFFLAIGDNVKRRDHYKNILNKKGTLPTLIHKDARVHESSTIGQGTIVTRESLISPNAKIGNNVIINSRALIEHDCVIDDHVHIAPDTSLAGHVTIEEGAFIGLKSSIKDGIQIGKWAKVGAGSVVVDHVPSGAIVAGNPARIIHMEQLPIEHCHEDPVLNDKMSIRKAMEEIDYTGSGFAMVCNNDEHCIGIITDGLIRRSILAGTSLNEPIRNVMNQDFFYLDEENEHDAVNHFSYFIHFIPILDSSRKLVKILKRKDVFLDHGYTQDQSSRQIKHIYRWLKNRTSEDYDYTAFKEKVNRLSKLKFEDIYANVQSVIDLIITAISKEYSTDTPVYISQLIDPRWKQSLATHKINYKPVSCISQPENGMLIVHESEFEQIFSTLLDLNSFSWVVESHGFKPLQEDHQKKVTRCIFMEETDEVNAEGACALSISDLKLDALNTVKIQPIQIACANADLEHIEKHHVRLNKFIIYMQKYYPEFQWKTAYKKGLIGIPSKEVHSNQLLDLQESDFQFELIETEGVIKAIVIKQPFPKSLQY